MKTLIVTAGITATSLAIAGNTHNPSSSVNAMQNNMYVQAQLGYAQTNIKNATPTTGHSTLSWKNGNGGFAWGLNVGYQFNKNIALEVGGFYLPKATASVSTDSVSYKSWVGYAAAKLSAPVMDNVDVYAKVGLGYQHTKVSGTISSHNTTNTHIGPAFGAGVDYTITDNVFVNVQYMRFAGKTTSGATKNTNPNVWTAGIGYKFSL